MRLLALILLLVACSSPEKDEGDSDFDYATPYGAYVSRLSEFTEDGWIVSRHPDGSTEHEGDSLLWTGIAMSALPCDEGKLYSDRMIRMVIGNGGALVRYEPLGEYEGGREVSFDGATGLYFGIIDRVLRCPGSIGEWADVWQIHSDYLEATDGWLNTAATDTTGRIWPPFTVLPDYISFLLGQGGKPSPDRIRLLELETALWTGAVITSEQSCFRIHLSWLYIRSLERLGELSKSGFKNFCAASQGALIPLIDDYCGRSDLSAWKFVENEWEYRSQRCGGWETPDGNGLRTPGLDLILAYGEKL